MHTQSTLLTLLLTRPTGLKSLKLLLPLTLVLLVACSPQSNDDRRSERSADLEVATPESVGMDSARLNRVTEQMQAYVDAGQLSGVVTMAARRGRIVHAEAVGYRDIEANDPLETSDIFRIYSMTKPITGVALMVLYEEGKFRLSDPVSQHIPEFADLRVATGVDANGEILTEEADHPMTVRELMSHTGGLSYGLFSQSAVDDMYNEVGVLDPNSTLQEMIDKLADIPLRQQPGSVWHYSVAVDVQGYLVEKLSGQKFGDFLQQRIFDPLGMVDTDWYVTPEKANRFAQVYSYGENGELVSGEGFPGSNFSVNPTFQSGGGGLVSTAMDYMRFSQMLLNGGELNGVRILSPMTVRLMHRNQLPAGVPNIGSPGTLFGLDFAITANPVEAESYSRGEYYWGGAAGTWFWIDPVEDLVFVGMIQQFGGQRPNVRASSRQAVYQAITRSQGSRQAAAVQTGGRAARN
ncbi:MAG: serine hydrolase domain-containing protein [Pseudohongiellaceae bacterium]